MSGYESTPLRAGMPAGSPSSYATKEEIASLLRGTDPGVVAASGQAYLDFAAAYQEIMTNLRGFSTDLARAWQGPASNAAQSRLRELFVAAYQIQTHANQVGTAVHEHGAGYLAWYQQNMPTPKTLDEARQWMTGANQRITQTWEAIPPQIVTSLPPLKASNPRDEYGTPSGGSAGGGSSVSGGAGGWRSTPGVAPAPGQVSTPGHQGWSGGASTGSQGQAPGDVGGGSGGGTRLAGFTPPAGSGSGGGLGGPGLSGGNTGGGLGEGGGFLPGGLMPEAAGAGSAGGGLGGGSLPGEAGGFGIGPGAGGGLGRNQAGVSGPMSAAESAVAEEAASAGAAGRAGMGPGMLGPGMGHGGGERAEERDRSTWLAEDPETWYGDQESGTGVIGGPTQLTDKGTIAEPAPAFSSDSETAALLKQLIDRLDRLEDRSAAIPPPPREPRVEWTD